MFHATSWTSQKKRVIFFFSSQGIRSTQTAATLLYSSFRMPLSDFKCLQSGQNVVWTLYYDQTEQTFLRDQASMRLATERLPWEYGRPEMYGTVVWCKTESGIQTVKDILSKAVLKLLGKKRRQTTSAWRQCVCCLTCLWLCNPDCISVVVD